MRHNHAVAMGLAKAHGLTKSQTRTLLDVAAYCFIGLLDHAACKVGEPSQWAPHNRVVQFVATDNSVPEAWFVRPQIATFILGGRGGLTLHKACLPGCGDSNVKYTGKAALKAVWVSL
jgi:hypothetical protein